MKLFVPENCHYWSLFEIKVIYNDKRCYYHSEDDGSDKAACYFLYDKHADN